MAAANQQRSTVPTAPEDVVKAVQDRYASIVKSKSKSGCCGPAASCCGSGAEVSTGLGYTPEELQVLPDGADLGLGCGAPLASLGLQLGESVLDLGSGAGIDVLIAARQVGPEGRVIGVDMTPEMVAKARTTAAEAGADHVEIRQGRLESLPVESASIDAVTSNCVINLVPDKAAVFREVARVLRPGGRMAVSDIMLAGALPEAVSEDLLAYVGCVAGAIDRDVYFSLLQAAGMGDVTIIKDIDFLAFAGETLPAEVQDLLARTGVTVADLRGTVRSVTYVAHKV